MKKCSYVFTLVIGSAFLYACEGESDHSQESGSENDQDEEQELSDEEENYAEDDAFGEPDNEEPSADEEGAVEETVYLYYSGSTEETDSHEYKEKTTIYADSEDELYWAAIHTWASDSDHEVGSMLAERNVEVEYAIGNGGIAEVSFSEDILSEGTGSGLDSAFHEQVALIMSEFGYDSTQILVEGERRGIFGHVASDEPIAADPERAEAFEAIGETETTEDETSTNTSGVQENLYLYYSEEGDEGRDRYQIEETIYADSKEELYWAAMHTWASDPDHEVGDVLVSHDVEVEYVQENDGVAEVSFSEELFDIDYHVTLNDAFQEQVGLIMREFGYDSTQIFVNGEEIDAPLFVGDEIIDRPFQLHEDRKDEYEERN